MANRAPLSQVEKERIYRGKLAGYTLPELAAEVGCSVECKPPMSSAFLGSSADFFGGSLHWIAWEGAWLERKVRSSVTWTAMGSCVPSGGLVRHTSPLRETSSAFLPPMGKSPQGSGCLPIGRCHPLP